MDAQDQCDHLPDALLAEIQREIDRGNCPSALRGPLCALLAEVKILRSQVEVLEQERRPPDSDMESDTTLL